MQHLRPTGYLRAALDQPVIAFFSKILVIQVFSTENIKVIDITEFANQYKENELVGRTGF